VHSPVLLSILGTLALFPLSELAIQIVHALHRSYVPTLQASENGFRSGIPDECATLVVVPMMLVSEAAIRGEVEKLEVRYLANPQRKSLFCSLLRLLDAPGPIRFGRCRAAGNGAQRHCGLE